MITLDGQCSLPLREIGEGRMFGRKLDLGNLVSLIIVALVSGVNNLHARVRSVLGV